MTASPPASPPSPKTPDEVVRIYGRLIDFLVARFVRWDRTLDRDDLKQVALMTFVDCLRTYDPLKTNPETGRSYSFSAYASRSAHTQLRRYVMRQAKQGIALAPEIKAGVDRVRVRSLTDDESPDRFDEGSTFTSSSAERTCLAVDHPLEQLVDDPELWRIAERVLTHREYWLVWSVYHQGFSLAQAGRLLGLTRPRMSQVHREALEKLRPHLTEFAAP